jgi:hypothetical protein
MFPSSRIALYAIPLFAIALGAARPRQDWQMPRYDATRPMARSGFAGRVTYLSASDPEQATVILNLLRARDTIEVYLGPRWFVEPRLIGPVRGERASVRGSRAFFRGRVVIVAATLVTEHSTLVLRDSTGAPAWDHPPVIMVTQPRRGGVRPVARNASPVQ